MWQLLGNIVSSFLLLRDFFGYLLPGAAFVAGLFYSTDLGDRLLLPGFQNWIIVIGGSYLCGHILVSLGYTAIHGLHKFTKRRICDINDIELYNPKFLYYRSLYPHLYYEVDRQDVLRITLATSLILNPWLTPIALRIFVFFIGLFLFFNGYIWFNAVRRKIRPETLVAAKMMETEDRRLDAECRSRRGS